MRYVPQSNYFDPSDLTTQTSILYPKDKKRIQIRQTVHLTSPRVDYVWNSWAYFLSERLSFSIGSLLKLMGAQRAG